MLRILSSIYRKYEEDPRSNIYTLIWKILISEWGEKSRRQTNIPYISIGAKYDRNTLIYLTFSSPSRILTFNLHICHSFTEDHPSPSPLGYLTPQRTTLTFDFQVKTPSTPSTPKYLIIPLNDPLAPSLRQERVRKNIPPPTQADTARYITKRGWDRRWYGEKRRAWWDRRLNGVVLLLAGWERLALGRDVPGWYTERDKKDEFSYVSGVDETKTRE